MNRLLHYKCYFLPINQKISRKVKKPIPIQRVSLNHTCRSKLTCCRILFNVEFITTYSLSVLTTVSLEPSICFKASSIPWRLLNEVMLLAYLSTVPLVMYWRKRWQLFPHFLVLSCASGTKFPGIPSSANPKLTRSVSFFAHAGCAILLGQAGKKKKN